MDPLLTIVASLISVLTLKYTHAPVNPFCHLSVLRDQCTIKMFNYHFCPDIRLVRVFLPLFHTVSNQKAGQGIKATTLPYLVYAGTVRL